MSKRKIELIKQIRKLYEELRLESDEKWNRDLPLEELLFNRWERAKKLGFGEGTSIYHSSHVYGDVKVGSNTWIGPFTILDGSGGLKIGDYCSISAGVHIYSHNTVKWAVSGGVEPYERKPVNIGNCCFIGPHSIIKDGVSIGEYTVVGACSFVNKDIPSYSIAVGVPATVIGRVQLDDNNKVNFEHLG